MIVPPPAVTGSVLRLIAPSGPFSKEQFEVTVQRLEQRFEVRYREDIFTRHHLFAGPDARRAQELEEAIADPDARAIIAARGGYGATRLLDQVDFSALPESPKWLVGFSDVTALHAQWARLGVSSLHAPMVSWLGARGPEETERFCQVLAGTAPDDSPPLDSLAPGKTKGRLIGGNLAVLTSLAGTPYFPNLSGAILFVEDVAERPYRIDRMLVQLRQAGQLDGVVGVVLGEFVHCDPGPDGVSVQDVIRLCFQEDGIPVAAGFPAGHGDVNRALMLGASYTLECDSSGAKLSRR